MSAITANNNEHSPTEILKRLRDKYRRCRICYTFQFAKNPEKLKAVVSDLEQWFYNQFVSVMREHKPTGLVRYADFFVKGHYGGANRRLIEPSCSPRLELNCKHMDIVVVQKKLAVLKEAAKSGLTCAICLNGANKPSVCLHCRTLVGCYDCCVQAALAAVQRNTVPKCPLCRRDWLEDVKRNVLQIRGLQELTDAAFTDDDESS